MPVSDQSSASSNAINAMDILSKFLLAPGIEALGAKDIGALDAEEFERLVALAHSNHVIVRSMEAYRNFAHSSNNSRFVECAEEIIATEQLRIAKATAQLRLVCDEFAGAGFDVTVMKTLDHWPDFGSDIDLYTNTSPAEVCALMENQFGARIASRSWGDRLAGKWNFEIPGLSEAVEIHMCRLGQTGEQLTLARNVPMRSRVVAFDGYEFPVPSPSDRIMISTLQRMYRHFYFRLCDIVDSASLIESGVVDWDDLRRSSEACGIWEGTATYLVLVSDYVKRYSGIGLALPAFVKRTARFDGRVMHFRGSFLRVPIMPQSAGLYWSQLVGSLRRGEIYSGARLGILPWLATSAAIGYKITGSDKGIW
jgi:hypothetical protein